MTAPRGLAERSDGALPDGTRTILAFLRYPHAEAKWLQETCRANGRGHQFLRWPALPTVCAPLFPPLQGMEGNSANEFLDALAAGWAVAINYSGWQSGLLAETAAGLLPSRYHSSTADELVAFLRYPGRVAEASAAACRERFSRDRRTREFEEVVSRPAERRGRREDQR
jgi:hypothetical protein